MTLLSAARRAAATVLPRFDVSAAYVFGSQAREDATPQSDLDLRIVRGPTLDFGDLDEIRQEFSRRCETDVDIACAREQDFDAPFLAHMQREQVKIYAR